MQIALNRLAYKTVTKCSQQGEKVSLLSRINTSQFIKDKYKSIDPAAVQDLFINDWAF